MDSYYLNTGTSPFWTTDSLGNPQPTGHYGFTSPYFANKYNNSNNSNGNIAGYIGAGAGVLQGIGGLASAYMAHKNYNLAKKQFGFQKGLANRNLANQAKIINNTYDSTAQVAAGMIGGGGYNPATDTQGSYGMTDPAVVDRYTKKAKEKYVDGSPI